MDAKTKQLKEELDKLLPKIGNIVDDTCVAAAAAWHFVLFLFFLLQRHLDASIQSIPFQPHHKTPHEHSVPVSQDEDADTEVVRTWGTPRTGDDLLHHHDLLWYAITKKKWTYPSAMRAWLI